jgi:uncharacterized sporulation protein YeaH/YhbH (DUF444 family)
MFTEVDGASDRVRGAELAKAAEALLAEAQLDTIDVSHAVQLATASALLALYWEMRHERPSVPLADRAERYRRYRRPALATDPGA